VPGVAVGSLFQNDDVATDALEALSRADAATKRETLRSAPLSILDFGTRLPPAACRLPPAACRLPPAACRLPPAACRRVL